MSRRSAQVTRNAGLSARLLRCAILVLGCAGCTIVTDPASVQCVSQDDCPSGPWSCVRGLCAFEGNAAQWRCTETSARADALDIVVTRANDGTIVTGAEVVVCPGPSECAEPVLETVTDATGRVLLDPLPADFSGFAKVTAEGFVETVATLEPPFRTAGREVRLFSRPLLEDIAGSLGEAPLGGGLAFGSLRAFNCDDRPGDAASATLSPTAAGPTFYERGALVSTQVSDTDASGNAGILGLIPGTYSVAWRTGGRVIGTSTLRAEANAVAEAMFYAGVAE